MNILECSFGPQHLRADANPFHATPLALCGARPKKAFLPTHMNTSRTWESNIERQGRGGGPLRGRGGLDVLWIGRRRLA